MIHDPQGSRIYTRIAAGIGFLLNYFLLVVSKRRYCKESLCCSREDEVEDEEEEEEDKDEKKSSSEREIAEASTCKDVHRRIRAARDLSISTIASFDVEK